MITIVRFPILAFALSFLALLLSTQAGAFIRQRQGPLPKENRDDFNVVLGATLTLLGLVIGFTFSMAVGRYDQRKNYEESEANAIGTEFVRADLLAPPVAANVHNLLKTYVDRRIRFYMTSDLSKVAEIRRDTAQLQDQLWSAVRAEAVRTPSVLTALVAAGMNDVLNSEGYTQAAWWNRIPVAAWALMACIAVFGGALIGNAAHTTKNVLSAVFPLVISIAFFLIADLDSPRGGFIRVHPQNLVSLADSLKTR